MVKGELIKCWGANIVDIQHVESTAITAICAKPILDIAVQLESIQNMDINVLIDMGYDYCGPRHENEKYHLFVLRGANRGFFERCISLSNAGGLLPAEKAFCIQTNKKLPLLRLVREKQGKINKAETQNS